MGLIRLSDFLDAARQNMERIRAYQSLADGSGGVCDCIGLIIGAKRLAGGEWRGLHGCNYAARNEMTTFGPIESEADFFPGEVIYKARWAEDDGYELPERYREGGAFFTGDLTDYFHVGVVLSTDPLEIAHCTKDNPSAVDHEKRRWRFGGTLRGIDYREIGIETDETIGNVLIMREHGRLPIIMREEGRLGAKKVAEIPQETEARIVEKGRTWTRIAVDGLEGYVLNKYIYSEDPEEFWFGDNA